MPDLIGRVIAAVIAAAFLTACLGLGVVAGVWIRLDQAEVPK